MAFQHREFQTWLRDEERLRLYAQSALSDQKALSASIMKAESNLRHWESEAKESSERAVYAEAERDDTLHEVAMARLETEVAGDVWQPPSPTRPDPTRLADPD